MTNCNVKPLELSDARKLAIEQITSDLIKKKVSFNNKSYVDIVKLVKKDGFVVDTLSMDIDTTGLLYVIDGNKKKKDDTKIILVNENFVNPDNEVDVVFKKSRFVTAHEYGHYKLHRKSSQEPIFMHRSTEHQNDIIEIEAEYFARSLLMPKDRFQKCCELISDVVKDNENVFLDVLSRFFQVTRNKVKLRMEDMKTLG